MSDFSLVYDHFDPGTEGLRESLTSTGNGYFCTRGTAEWEDATGVHYAGTYAGISPSGLTPVIFALLGLHFRNVLGDALCDER